MGVNAGWTVLVRYRWSKDPGNLSYVGAKSKTSCKCTPSGSIRNPPGQYHSQTCIDVQFIGLLFKEKDRGEIQSFGLFVQDPGGSSRLQRKVCALRLPTQEIRGRQSSHGPSRGLFNLNASGALRRVDIPFKIPSTVQDFVLCVARCLEPRSTAMQASSGTTNHQRDLDLRIPISNMGLARSIPAETHIREGVDAWQ